MVLDVAYAPMQGHFGLTVSALSGNRCSTTFSRPSMPDSGHPVLRLSTRERWQTRASWPVCVSVTSG